MFRIKTFSVFYTDESKGKKKKALKLLERRKTLRALPPHSIKHREKGDRCLSALFVHIAT